MSEKIEGSAEGIEKIMKSMSLSESAPAPGTTETDSLKEAIGDIDVVAIFNKLVEYVSDFKLPEFPATVDVLNYVTNMHLVFGAILCFAGFAYLALGLKKYKLFMMINGALLGVVVGGFICVWLKMPDCIWYGMAIVGIVVGAVCWPLARALVVLIGGGIGAIVGYLLYAVVFNRPEDPSSLDYQWVGSVIGAVLIAIVFLYLFKLGLMLMTTVQGAIMLTAGGLKIISLAPAPYKLIEEKILAEPTQAVLAMSGFVIVGIAIQLSFFFGEYKKEKEEGVIEKLKAKSD